MHPRGTPCLRAEFTAQESSEDSHDVGIDDGRPNTAMETERCGRCVRPNARQALQLPAATRDPPTGSSDLVGECVQQWNAPSQSEGGSEAPDLLEGGSL